MRSFKQPFTIHRYPSVDKFIREPGNKSLLLLSFFNLEIKIKNAELRAVNNPFPGDVFFTEEVGNDKILLVVRVNLGTGERYYQLNNLEWVVCTNSLTVRELTLLLG